MFGDYGSQEDERGNFAEQQVHLQVEINHSISLIIIMYYIHMKGSNILFFFFNFFLSLFFSNNLRVKQF